MELFWMAVISVTAVAVAIIIGDKMDTKLCLKMEVRDRAKLQKQVEDLADEGILFAEQCYCKGLIPLHNGKSLAAEYIKSVLKNAYKTRVVDQDQALETLIEERIEQAGNMEEKREEKKSCESRLGSSKIKNSKKKIKTTKKGIDKERET